MNNRKIYITAILAITAVNFSFAQIRTVNSDTVGNATNSSAFIDVTSNTSINGNPNLGKGLLFPQTDLSLFTTFGGAPFGLPTNYATYYDGMIVYNTKDGGKAGVGTTQGELKPGFWYYENKSKNVNGGTWKQISSPTTNQLTLTGNSLISTVNGVASNSITLPVGNDVSASNGLSKTGDNIKLGGALTEETTITTNGANRLFIRGNSTNAINFGDNTLSIDAQNNRVGIGTNDPTRTLDIDGDLRIRGVQQLTFNEDDRLLAIGPGGLVYKTNIPTGAKVGDVKYGFQTADHDGWFVLNGRSVSSLPANSRNAASSTFGANLPDARGKVVKMKGTLGSTGGDADNYVFLQRANLPYVTLSATTSSNGNHTHHATANPNSLLARGTSSRVALDRQGLSSSYGFSDTVHINQLLNQGSISDSGNHAHTVSMQLNNAASQAGTNIEDSYLSVNVFVYLGQ